MKTLLNYFDRDGKPLGKKLDSARRKKFYVAMATVRRKIAEHEGQNPFRKKKYGRHEVAPYTRTYCDANRAHVFLEIFEEGKKKSIVTQERRWYHPQTDEDVTRSRIFQNITDNFRTYFPAELGLKYIFMPDGNRIDTENPPQRRR